MKIRTDFVTNSSSSGYVVITVVDENGKSVDYEYEYDSGYGGYFWNGDLPYGCKTCSQWTQSGSELIKRIQYLVDDTVLATQEGKRFISAVKELKAVRTYSIAEKTHYDTGGEDSAEYTLRYSTPQQMGDYSYARYSEDELGKVHIDIHEGNPRLDVADEIDNDPAEGEDYYETDPQIDFEGKMFAFGGVGGSGAVDEHHPVVVRVMQRGGLLSKKVTETTDYLIVNPGLCRSSKIDGAIELQKKGCNIKIILLKDLRKILEQPIQSKTTIESIIDRMSLFDKIENMEPTYHSTCLYFGAFRNDATGLTWLEKPIANISGGDTASSTPIGQSLLEKEERNKLWRAMGALFQQYGWNPAELESYVEEINMFKSPFDRKFIVVGDITVERFAAGELEEEYQKLEEYKKKYKVGVYAESDFFSIGKNHYAPFPKIQLDSIAGLTVCCKGEFKKGRVFQNNCIKAHGGIHQSGFPTKATDVFVISDETFESCSCTSIRLADSIEKCWKSYQKTGRPLLFTESDFTALGFFTMPGGKKKQK